MSCVISSTVTRMIGPTEGEGFLVDGMDNGLVRFIIVEDRIAIISFALHNMEISISFPLTTSHPYSNTHTP